MAAAATMAAKLRQLAEAAESSALPAAELSARLTELAQGIALSCTQPPPATADAIASPKQPVSPAIKRQRKGADRAFDFSRYRTRHVALEVMYVGTSYQGFARQDSTENTIEAVLFAALRRTCLIPSTADIGSLNYSRCGRTDKGVSALGQVVALMLRSAARVDAPMPDQEYAGSYGNGAPLSPPSETQAKPSTEEAAASSAPQGATDAATTSQDDGSVPVPTRRGPDRAGLGDAVGLPPADQELDYPHIINRVLPPEIRVLGWAPAPPDFNARFSCQFREYKYFIVDRDGGLDIEAMRQAAQHFLGDHDFRNFCKADVLAVKSFMRQVQHVALEPWGLQAHVAHPTVAPSWHGRAQGAVGLVPAPPAPPQATGAAGHTGSDRSEVYAFTVRGTAFLWHQVRCMVAVLLMVGRRLEPPDVVARLLDVQAVPSKPVYIMAPEEPLLLYASGFEGLRFNRGPSLVTSVSAQARDLSERHLVASALAGAIAARLVADDPAGHSAAPSTRGPPHVPLLRRHREASVAERMANAGITALGDKPGAVAATAGPKNTAAAPAAAVLVD